MLKLIPADHKEEESENRRRRINSRMAFDKAHEDPFFNMDPSPSPRVTAKVKASDRARADKSWFGY